MLDRPFEMLNQKQGVPFTLLECAEFCSNIYTSMQAPKGWELLNIQDIPSSGFRAACYSRNLFTETAQVAFVYRGTVLTFPDVISDLINDIKVAFDKIPSLSGLATQFMIDCLIILQTRYQSNINAMQYISYITTGHSLGAILANLASCLVACRSTESAGYLPSVTFENPGSLDMVTQMINNECKEAKDKAIAINSMQSCCNTYQAGVNLINTTNAQTGTAYRIGNLDYKYSILEEYILSPVKIDNYYDNLVYCVDNTPYQHGIVNIVNYISKNNPLIKTNSPPNLQAGYIEYMNPDNKKYWEGYFKAVWNSDTDAGINARIAFTVDDYITHGMYGITNIYNKISKQSNNMSNSKFILFNAQKLIESFTMVDKPIEQTKEDTKNNTRCSIM